MEFHRLGYPLFLLGVWVLAALARGSRTARNLILLIASLCFYAYADPRFVMLLAGVTVVAFLGARAVAPRAGGGSRKGALAGLIALELSGLAFFKYYDFLAETLNGAMNSLGKAEMLPILQLVAVAGVSFYTFQAIGYLVDVFRGEVEPETDFIAFALFVCFFPQLLAGPIGRAGTLLPQWKAEPRREESELSNGLFLMISGACKKVLIGDFIGTRIVNPAFTYPTGIGWIGVLLGVYGFAFQLYGDFAGYSEMAVGSAKCFGIKLTNNFNAPYRSRNVTEFWNRWHISLSTWIRDYVFLPISGRAPSRTRSHVAAITSMTLCGLWHGASFAWIGWGFLHGVGLSIHQTFVTFLRKRFALKKKLDKSMAFRAAAVLLTFHFCCIGLFLVRAGDPQLQGVKTPAEAWSRLKVMAAELFRSPRGDALFFVNILILACFALAIASHAMPGNIKLKIARGWDAVPGIAQGAIFVAVALLLYVVRPDLSPFIYTNF